MPSFNFCDLLFHVSEGINSDRDQKAIPRALWIRARKTINRVSFGVVGHDLDLPELRVDPALETMERNSGRQGIDGELPCSIRR